MQEQFSLFFIVLYVVFGVQSGAYKRVDPEFNSTNQHPVHVSVHLLNHT